MTQQLDLAQSYRYCTQIARTQARNFYYGFLLLPRPRRQALCSMYAFFRACDDFTDEAGTLDGKRQALEDWRARLQIVLADPSQAARLGPIFPAFSHAVRRYAIPALYFHDLLDGALMDLDKFTYETFDELYAYCYRVASTVGLVCLHIFGFDGTDEALKMGEWCGIAFQLTNILRDVEEDVNMGRVYLPQADLCQFGLSSSDLASPPVDDRFQRLMAFEAARAQHYYDRSAPLLDRVHDASRPGFAALVSIYHGLLKRIEQEEYHVHGRRVRLSTGEKVMLLARSLLRKGRVLPSPGPARTFEPESAAAASPCSGSSLLEA